MHPFQRRWRRVRLPSGSRCGSRGGSLPRGQWRGWPAAPLRRCQRESSPARTRVPRQPRVSQPGGVPGGAPGAGGAYRGSFGSALRRREPRQWPPLGHLRACARGGVGLGPCEGAAAAQGLKAGRLLGHHPRPPRRQMRASPGEKRTRARLRWTCARCGQRRVGLRPLVAQRSIAPQTVLPSALGWAGGGVQLRAPRACVRGKWLRQRALARLEGGRCGGCCGS
mmetsp:Transcript_12022/g.32277  ORF Transcript_12022/g.32277 Transcript_12022/m.32277 type:complete len:224 (-) Transcript_12022:456-1127(-)